MRRLYYAFLIAWLLCAADARGESARPNFVIIFADDQGYGDLGCFGSTKIKTPNIDRMAQEGRRFTNFMVASPVCTPSRAALLTGCYPKRIGMHEHVLFPASTRGLHPNEHTIADQLKSLGYATACFGKWHLGHHPETLPMQNGFDTYFGIPYSNDMNHPDNQGKPKIPSDDLWRDQDSAITKWNTPLFENEEIVELPVDQRTVTRRYTERAIDFIQQHKDEPFFVYLPHSMPHIPLYVPQDAYDPDPANAYTCVIEHIDGEVGRLMDTIRNLNLSQNTYVIYTSDNGPWLQFKNHGGSAGPLRDGKGTTFEGGQRVPCVMWGPGRIPAGTECHDVVATIDMLPTIAGLTNSTLPTDHRIDGIDMSHKLLGTEGAASRDEYLYYTSQGEIEGIRQGQWKLLAKVKRPNRNNPSAEPETTIHLFDLDADVGEKNDVSLENPKLVAQLTKRMHELDAEITAQAREAWFKKP